MPPTESGPHLSSRRGLATVATPGDSSPGSDSADSPPRPRQRWRPLAPEWGGLAGLDRGLVAERRNVLHPPRGGRGFTMMEITQLIPS